MSPRTGRPKAENPKNVELTVRFDKETHDGLLKYCEKHGFSRGEAVRKGVHLLLGKTKK